MTDEEVRQEYESLLYRERCTFDELLLRRAQLSASQAEVGRYRGVLTEVSEGRGPFSRDKYEHACNVIEAMKDIARAALASVDSEGVPTGVRAAGTIGQVAGFDDPTAPSIATVRNDEEGPKAAPRRTVDAQVDRAPTTESGPPAPVAEATWRVGSQVGRTIVPPPEDPALEPLRPLENTIRNLFSRLELNEDGEDCTDAMLSHILGLISRAREAHRKALDRARQEILGATEALTVREQNDCLCYDQDEPCGGCKAAARLAGNIRALRREESAE